MGRAVLWLSFSRFLKNCRVLLTSNCKFYFHSLPLVPGTHLLMDCWDSARVQDDCGCFFRGYIEQNRCIESTSGCIKLTLLFLFSCCCCLPLPGVIQCNFVPLRLQPKTGYSLLNDKHFPKKKYLILSG